MCASKDKTAGRKAAAREKKYTQAQLALKRHITAFNSGMNKLFRDMVVFEGDRSHSVRALNRFFEGLRFQRRLREVEQYYDESEDEYVGSDDVSDDDEEGDSAYYSDADGDDGDDDDDDDDDDGDNDSDSDNEYNGDGSPVIGCLRVARRLFRDLEEISVDFMSVVRRMARQIGDMKDVLDSLAADEPEAVDVFRTAVQHAEARMVAGVQAHHQDVAAMRALVDQLEDAIASQ